MIWLILMLLTPEQCKCFEGRPADGIVQLTTSFSEDMQARGTAENMISGNENYNACYNNCSTFVQSYATVYQLLDASPVNNLFMRGLGYKSASVVAPNNLYNAALGLKGAKNIKVPTELLPTHTYSTLKINHV